MINNPQSAIRDPRSVLARLGISLLAMLAWSCDPPETNEEVVTKAAPSGPRVQHVYPGDDLQAALDRAAENPDHKSVLVHAGTYRPKKPGHALIWLNARHDGVRLSAVGEVTLTAANPDIARQSDASYPAVVHHVIYFGDGISRKTLLRGFKITGANHFLSGDKDASLMEPCTQCPEKDAFFYLDGGGIKIFGRSYPTILDVHVHDNYASPCAGGVSVQHPKPKGGARHSNPSNENSVLFRNCVFENNRTRVTGSALDLLWGSSAVLENCLFVGNISNTGTDFTVEAGARTQYDSEHGCGAMTVFPGSGVRVTRCTFTGNFNGIDDMSAGNTYTDSIFWSNKAQGGISPGQRYELALRDGRGVSGCFVHGDIDDLRGTVDSRRNTLAAPNPRFDSSYRPQAPEYAKVGYRPK
jgi:hypothetical protein